MNAQELDSLWDAALESLNPAALLDCRRTRPSSDEAVLCWGKAAGATWAALGRRGRCLVIAPDSGPPGSAGVWWFKGEHPLPGEGSFTAGTALLEFFQALSRFQVRRLRVFLSGGASSLAWIPPPGVGRRELLDELQRLYKQPLDISELNARRGRLCQLKGGGAARWLRALAPGVGTRVEVLSDVLPFGPEVVGSGPFQAPGIRCRVLADNRTLVGAILRESHERGIPVLGVEAGRRGPWRRWVSDIVRCVSRARRARGSGLMIWAGEPQVKLSGREAGLGGRQSHLALALALELRPWLRSGRLSLLCGASDGVDGLSGSGGVVLDRTKLQNLGDPGLSSKGEKALREMDSGGFWFREARRALLPSRVTGTNLQDSVLVHVDFR